MATTATPGSGARTGRELVARFGRTERALHWVHTAGFAGMLATGLVLYLPALSARIGDRPLIKAIHLAVAIAWLAGLLVVFLAGDRRQLRRTRQELERFTDDDVRWLRRKSPAPAGRFNAGQKAHSAIQAAFAVLFVVSGVLLWLGERNTDLRFGGTIAVHDVTMFVALVLLAGHLYLALVSDKTSPAMPGMIGGNVRADWAREHHPAWDPGPPRFGGRAPSITRGALAACAVVLVAGGVASVLIVRDTLDSGSGPGTAPTATTAAAPPAVDGLALAAQAQALEGQGDPQSALTLWAQAAQALPSNADIRAGFGLNLARNGRSDDAIRQLREARRLDPKDGTLRLYLGASLRADGQKAAARAELRAYLAGDDTERAGEVLARQMLSELR